MFADLTQRQRLLVKQALQDAQRMCDDEDEWQEHQDMIHALSH